MNAVAKQLGPILFDTLTFLKKAKFQDGKINLLYVQEVLHDCNFPK
jgi:hypothetical protein